MTGRFLLNQIDKLKSALADRYQVNIPQFLRGYEAGATMDELRIALGMTEFPMRTIASALNLRWPQKHRVNDLALLMSRSDEDTSTLADEVITLKEDLKQYEHDLTIKDKALTRVRREANRLRAEMREESLDDVVVDMVAEALANIPAPIAEQVPRIFKGPGVDFAVLSDFHAGATVSNEDVPDNTYSWEILEEKVGVMFQEMAANRTGDEYHFYILGDMLDGLIHDSLEASDMNPAKAAK